MSLISGTDFVLVPTKDWEAAKRYYTEVLELPFTKQWGPMPAGEFETGNLTIAVMQSDAFGREFKASSAAVALHVDDFAAAKATLEERGVRFLTDVIDSGVCLQAYFEDPDGNALGIHHRYAEGVTEVERPPG